MELKVVHYVSDEDQKIVASRYFLIIRKSVVKILQNF